MRSLHWSDLHRMLVDALPPGTVHFGHTVTDIEQPDGDNTVSVTASIAAPRAAGGNGGDGNPSAGKPRVQEFKGDLVVAADGQMSQTRQRNVPQGDSRRCSCPSSCMTMLAHCLSECSPAKGPAEGLLRKLHHHTAGKGILIPCVPHMVSQPMPVVIQQPKEATFH